MKTLKHMLLLVLTGVLPIAVPAQEPVKSDRLTFDAFEAKLKQASPNAQIIDVRTAEEFKLNHLKGAVQLDISKEEDVNQLLDKLDKTKPVFVYSINNGRSATLVKTLKARSFNEAYELPGGIAKWIGAGRPVESTANAGLTPAEYKKLIASDKLVLVDVHSKFCGGCKKLSPIVDEVGNANSNNVKVVKLELFENKQIGKELNIQSVPTLILYKGDKIVWQKTGAISKEDIESALLQEYAKK